MKKDPLVFITYIIECIELIEKYIKGKTKKEFLQDIQLQDSVIRRIEIIGEATKNIPKALKDKYPDISWKRIAGTQFRITPAPKEARPALSEIRSAPSVIAP